MGKHKPLSIDYTKCSACSAIVCVGVCPQGILEADSDKKPQIIDAASCTLCGVCVNLCPAKAITVNSSETTKKRGG